MSPTALNDPAQPLHLLTDQIQPENTVRLLIWAFLVVLASAALVGLLMMTRGGPGQSTVQVDIGPGSLAYKEYLDLINNEKPPEVIPLETVSAIPPDRAQAINASVPFVTSPLLPARPFVLQALADDFDRARDCLAAAMWYETGTDWDGQRAVAQVVLNRLRHPAFPKSVCGVVFQGSERRTGCQFSFTCDGSMARHPPDALWQRTRRAAEAALSGAVDPRVGLATHYHTDWVAPYWSKELDKISAVRTHLFFRWRGNWGSPVAFQAKPARTETGIAKLAALSPQHAKFLRIDPLASEHALLEYDIPLANPAVDGPMRAAGQADSAQMHNLPRLRGGLVQIVHPEGDAFVVRLNPASSPGSYAVDALALCGSQVFCKVMGWLDDGSMPRRFPIGTVSNDTIAFLFTRQNGHEAARWDCSQIKGRPPGPNPESKCLGTSAAKAPGPALTMN